MIKCYCRTVRGLEVRYAYSVNDFDVNTLINPTVSDKCKYKEFATFDTETTKIPNNPKTSAMYHWQFCIQGATIFGRTWLEFFNLIDELNTFLQLTENKKLVIYSHNLSFEFQFIKDFLEISSVFAMKKRKILKFETKTIEYRCSYLLTNKALDKTLSTTLTPNLLKSKGDLNHDIIRTSETIYNSIENGYAYTDVRGLFDHIKYLLQNDTLESIPLTSTGYVRRECRKVCSDRQSRSKFLSKRLTVEQYILCKKLFRGGNTASSRFNVNKIINDVESFDITSSYPYHMLLPEYPTTKFTFADIEIDELEEYNSKYCTMATYLFSNVRLKPNIPIPYLSVSKLDKYGKVVNYNGRVLSSDYIVTHLTNIDFDIFKTQYDFDEVTVKDFYFSRKGYLNINIRNKVIEFFKLKCELAGGVNPYLYAKSKEKLNAIYGMMVSAIDHDEYSYKNGIITETKIKRSEMQEALDKYYKSYNSFLSYQDGVFITALSRRSLQKAIDGIGLDLIYVDTDSVKFKGKHSEFMNSLNQKMRDYNKANNINNSVLVNGKTFSLGEWEIEKPYDKFKTLGAKKYAYTQNNKLSITIAGVPKKAGRIELERKGGLEEFKDGFIFNESNKLSVSYFDSKPHSITINGVKMLAASSATLVPTEYCLGISGTIKDFIDNITK